MFVTIVKDLFNFFWAREECQNPKKVWKWKKFWPCWRRKNGRYDIIFQAQKLYIASQHELFVNLVR